VGRTLSALKQQRDERKKQARNNARSQNAQRQGDAAKILVRETGMVRVDATQIAQALNLSTSRVTQRIRSGRFILQHAGENVAWQRLAGDTGIQFYTRAIHSQYTDDDVYWLKQGKGTTMPRDNRKLPKQALPPSGFMQGATFEGNTIAALDAFTDADADYRMWNVLYAHDPDWVSWGIMLPDCVADTDFKSVSDQYLTFSCGAYQLATPGVQSQGDVTLTVSLHGGTKETHHVSLRLNGTAVAEFSWQGMRTHEASFSIPANLLSDINTLEVSAEENPGVFDFIYVNDFKLDYPRRYQAHNGMLITPPAESNSMQINGFESGDINVYDITKINQPRWLKHTVTTGYAGGYQVSFATRTGHRYIALQDNVFGTPQQVVADIPSTLRDERQAIDYLVITSGESLVAAAQQLANYRSSQGLRSMVVDLEDIYDEFNHGVKSADAIWSFLAYSWHNWQTPPRYVVLAGDASFDYKNHFGYGDAIIPTLLTPTPEGLFPSDNLFVDLAGNDWMPEMSIGRIPVIDAGELSGFINKLIDYESSSGDWVGKITLSADNPDHGGDFTQDSEDLLELLPQAYDIEAIHLEFEDANDARERFIGGLNDGRAFVNFIGHGGYQGVGNKTPQLLSNSQWADDMPLLTNSDRLPVFTGMTCLSGYFGISGYKSLGEALLMKADGGSIAVWSASGLSLNHRAKLLDEGFYLATFEDGELVLGEAIIKAQQHYAKDGKNRYMLDIYNLLGDPATIMK